MNSKQAVRLLKAASLASRKAYAPYSRFHVGAALLLRGGRIVTGCNVENASYGLTTCAERVAIQNAVAAGQLDFTAIAVVADGKDIPLPCGACRQVLAEFCDPAMPVLVAKRSFLRKVQVFRLQELLPNVFKLKHHQTRQR